MKSYFCTKPANFTMKAIETLHLFEDLNQELIYFLAELKQHEWQLLSPMSGQNVKDMASLLLFGTLQKISILRDQYYNPDFSAQILQSEYEAQTRSREIAWLVASANLSPRLLLELIKKYEHELFELYNRLKQDETAASYLSSAETESMPNWKNIAFDYAQKWQLQMQMRMASQKQLLLSERFLTPLYETLMLKLLSKLDKCKLVADEYLLDIEITGEVRMCKRLQQIDLKWSFADITAQKPDSQLRIQASVAWKLFLNEPQGSKLQPDEIKFQGNKTLIMCLLE